MSNYSLVLDTNKRALDPVHPGLARKLLNEGKAAIYRRFPFTIILKEAQSEIKVQNFELKLDPGSKTTGLAILLNSKVIWAAELSHRGQAISNSLESRRVLRSGRRKRKTRYRPARFLNRTKPKGWLAPSLQHRVETTMTWVNRLIKLAPIGSIAQELVRFDMQKMQNPEISGIEYQQGELQGYEVREYLLEKWGRKCTYCDKKDVPLQIEHIHPKSKGGSNRIFNLCLACDVCNKTKNSQNVEDFLKNKPNVLKKIVAQAKAPLKDAAAVNSTRWALFNRLKQTGLHVSIGSGGQTKFNRTRLNLPKTHWIDASCVGQVNKLEILTYKPLLIKSNGHGTRQMCGTNKFGFPIRHRTRVQVHKGFQTGNIVKAIVIRGKKIGTYLGRLTCRATGYFDISTKNGRITSIGHKYCKSIHKKDGYSYEF